MLLTATDICKTYPGDAGPITVLDHVSLTLQPGETLALTGESGSGKSTLLTLLGGLDQPDTGDITLSGTKLTGLSETALAGIRRRDVGLVFQQFNLIPSLTVGQNISFQARLAGRLDQSWTDHLVHGLGLIDQLGKYPEALSGGQQQRVAVARTLAARPGLVLADEPTGNLDQATGDAVANIMLELVGESGAGLIVATHSERFAARLGHRAHLDRGQLS